MWKNCKMYKQYPCLHTFTFKKSASPSPSQRKHSNLCQSLFDEVWTIQLRLLGFFFLVTVFCLTLVNLTDWQNCCDRRCVLLCVGLQGSRAVRWDCLWLDVYFLQVMTTGDLVVCVNVCTSWSGHSVPEWTVHLEWPLVRACPMSQPHTEGKGSRRYGSLIYWIHCVGQFFLS